MKEWFLLPKRPTWISFQFNGFRVFFPRGQSDQGVKIGVQVYLLPKLERNGAIPLLLYTPVMAHKQPTSDYVANCYQSELYTSFEGGRNVMFMVL